RETFFFPHIGLTDQECFDLAVVTRLVERQGIPLLSEACHVRDKLMGTLPAKQQTLIVEASELFDILSVGLPEQGRCSKIMLTLQEGLLTKKQVEGIYRSPTEKGPKRIQIQPRRIFLCQGVWYLVAQDNKDTQNKLFRLSRFESVKPMEKPMT